VLRFNLIPLLEAVFASSGRGQEGHIVLDASGEPPGAAVATEGVVLPARGCMLKAG
jgi:hypothetical protein